MTHYASPFHAGEIAAQHRAGVAHHAAEAGHFIRNHMPRQHQDFFAGLPFLVVAGADEAGRRWASILEAGDGRPAVDDARRLALPGRLGADDPLSSGFVPGAAVGILGIELATRRRNRLNGRLREAGRGLALDVAQSFGNCPQFIQPREWSRVEEADHRPAPAITADELTDRQMRWIASADTFFIGSGVAAENGDAGGGFDASHRGGAPGFVEIEGGRRLRFPDYAGNNFFNTIGNLLRDPRIGLLFVDFRSGGLLHVTGRAEIVWDGGGSRDPQARREIVVTVEQVVERPSALALRWRSESEDGRPLRVVAKVVESRDITSFHLAPADSGLLAPFLPGQHLPVALKVPGQAGAVRRTYSLSGPASAPTYRISVKREPHGLASRYLHDHLLPGDVIEALAPAGDFVLPAGRGPLVLASAGVGVTPMMAMLHAVTEVAPGRRVFFVQGVRDGATHPFGREIAELAARAASVAVRIHYAAPRPADRPLPGHAVEGRMTVSDLLALEAGPEADYMICGPAGFIAELSEGLERSGVLPHRIHHETFGPAG